MNTYQATPFVVTSTEILGGLAVPQTGVSAVLGISLASSFPPTGSCGATPLPCCLPESSARDFSASGDGWVQWMASSRPQHNQQVPTRKHTFTKCCDTEHVPTATSTSIRWHWTRFFQQGFEQLLGNTPASKASNSASMAFVSGSLRESMLKGRAFTTDNPLCNVSQDQVLLGWVRDILPKNAWAKCWTHKVSSNESVMTCSTHSTISYRNGSETTTLLPTRQKMTIFWWTGIYANWPGIYAHFPGIYANFFPNFFHHTCQLWNISSYSWFQNKGLHSEGMTRDLLPRR